MKKHGLTILLVFVLIIGLSLMLYPTVSDWWNSMHQSKVMSDYKEKVADMDNKTYKKILDQAIEYNKTLAKDSQQQFSLNDSQLAIYEQRLNINENGVMGYVEIPSIDVSLPIYHGTSEKVLQVAIGHLDSTSLPVGGKGSHCVLSGHRGLPSSRLFTDLDRLVKGDTFNLYILDEVFTYEVDQILVVEPDDTTHLLREKGKDYCTLFTCTPYGINSHRLLVRGHRIQNATPQAVRVTADALLVEPYMVAPFVAIPVLLLLFGVLLLPKSKKNRRNSS